MSTQGKIVEARELISRREVKLGLLGAVFLLGALLLVDVWRPKREQAQ